jgi:hypothetical protein
MGNPRSPRRMKPRHVGHVLEWIRTIAPVLVLLKLYGLM